MITFSDFEKIDLRLKNITEQEVVVIEDNSQFPPVLEDLEDNNKTYSIMAAILFIDIRKSTLLTETSQVKSMVKIYRSFMRMAVDCVRKNDGVTRQFMGDRIMGVFKDTINAEGEVIESAATKAVNAARAMQTVLDFSLNKHLKSNVNGKVIECGIGIDYGRILVTKAGMYGVEADNTKENEISFVWVGNATNHASKYSDIADSGEIFVSTQVYKNLVKDLKVEDWAEIVKYKGANAYKGFAIKDYYLDFAENLEMPIRVSDDNLSHRDNAQQLADGIKAIEDLQNNLINREKELTVKEEKINSEIEKMKERVRQSNSLKDKAISDCSTYKKKWHARTTDYYYLLRKVVNKCHCSIPYIERMEKDDLLEIIEMTYQIGEEIDIDREETMEYMDCGLMEFYMYYDMPEKAFEALLCMARNNNFWVNIRKDIVEWSVANGKVWSLLAALQKRLDDWSVPYEKRSDFVNYVKKVKEIAGY